MKTLLLLLCLSFSLPRLSVQNWDEWFHQKATAKKYLREQIAALDVYLGKLKQGYEAAREGLTTIGEINNRDLFQHEEHFNSLQRANPSLLNWSKTLEITLCRQRITRSMQRALSSLSSTPYLEAGEKNYLRSVLQRLEQIIKARQTEFVSLLTPGELTLTDDERIRHIESLYSSLKQDQVFLQLLNEQTQGLALQRAIEKKGMIWSRKIQGL